MESYIYGIGIAVLIFKILLWMCICAIRSNRREHQRKIYIQSIPGSGQIRRVSNTRQIKDNDRASIVKNEEIPQSYYPPGIPPPYTDIYPAMNREQPSRIV
ncbi:uncharacterized protein LOC133174267 [Saccostrea echinata]|uniref:uncharacterized protein LOC133174267 n=1 Tax=Saccostrea echinata TaxID=191078 RepID=UPI002A800B3A|nr:uncharacterized protein LOC133174267 [Saccostrea echinata]